MRSGICDAKFGNIYRWDGDALHLVATHNTPPPSQKPAGAHRFVQVRNPYGSHGGEQKRWFTSPICGG